MDAILAEVYGVQSISQMNAVRKRMVPRHCHRPPLSFRGYCEQRGVPDRKAGCYVCYGQNGDHWHDHTRYEVNKREKAQ